MHSHLLPGIDDGSPDTDASALLIAGLQDLGFQKLVTTPHIMSDLYRNSRESIATAHELLQASFNNNSTSTTEACSRILSWMNMWMN